MADEEHRRLIRAWLDAYFAYRVLLPPAINFDSPDAAEQLASHKGTDWGGIHRAWERVGEAHRALQEFRHSI